MNPDPSLPGAPDQPDWTRRGFLGAVLGGPTLALTAAGAMLADSAAATAGSAQPGGIALLDDYVGRLCYNENPLGPSPLARAAILDQVDLGHRYPDWYAESLRADLVALHGVYTSQTIAGCGGTEMLRLAALAFAQAGRNVVSPYPTYTQFPSDCAFLGAEVRYSNLDANYRVNLTDMLSRVDSNTTAVCITNPNNPTGRVLTASALSAFVNALPSQVVVVLDEAYHEYVEDPAYQSAIELVRQGKNVVVIRTLSKVFGLAGVRVGYAIGRAERITAMSNWHLTATVSRLAQAAAQAALTDNQHLTSTKALNTQAKDYCFAAFAGMGLAYIPSETNFFMVDVGQSAAGVAAQLAARGIQVRTGWGMPNHLRVSTGTMADMQAFVSALQEILSVSQAPEGSMAAVTELYGSFPNPCSHGARISLGLARGDRARLQIHDVQGRLVRTILDSGLPPGLHEIVWDGRNDEGRAVAAGTYFYRLQCADVVRTRRLIVVQ